MEFAEQTIMCIGETDEFHRARRQRAPHASASTREDPDP